MINSLFTDGTYKYFTLLNTRQFCWSMGKVLVNKRLINYLQDCMSINYLLTDRVVLYFTLSNARWFYRSMSKVLVNKELTRETLTRENFDNLSIYSDNVGKWCSIFSALSSICNNILKLLFCVYENRITFVKVLLKCN